MDKWRIVALDTGTSVIEKSILTYLHDVGKMLRIPRVMWYLEGSLKVIVDTSVESEHVASEIIGENLYRQPEQEPRRALEAIGVDPESIDVVILTHLHWDHCGNNHLFPQARFLCQTDELRYAYAPPPFFQRAFLSPLGGFTPPFLTVKFELIDGDFDVAPGLQILKVPGHTPGSQAVRVKTSKGWHTITGDAVFTYENMEKQIPPGFHVNVDDAMASMAKIARLSDVILPSHDYKVFRGTGPEEFK